MNDEQSSASIMVDGRRRRPLRAGLAVSLVVLLEVFTPAFGIAADTYQGRKSVLILYPESQVLPAVFAVNEALRSRFTTAGVQVELFAEYLDLSWASGAGYVDDLRAFLRSKHRDRKFDVVIAVGSPSLRFALENRSGLFPGVPIVFCAVTTAGTAELQLTSDVTGVWMVPEPAATIAAARRLQPRAQRVVAVSGASALDKLFLDDVRRDLAGQATGLEISYLVGLPLEGLTVALSQLPRNTIVLFVSMLRDGAGRSLITRDALRLVAPHVNAPVYGLADTVMGSGIVGGRLISFKAQGAQAADMAIRILGGEPAARVGPVGQPANVYMFDWRQLKRWGFHERDLPPGSIVLNREPTLWELYRWHFIGAIGLIFGQTLLIVGLLVQRRRRRRAEVALQDRLGFETLVSDLSAIFVDLRGAEIEQGVDHGLRRIGEHLALDHACILEIAADGQAIHATHMWTSPTVAPLPLNFWQLPWSMELLCRGETVRFSRLDQLPEAAGVDRQRFASLGIQSAVGVPLIGGRTTIGALTLSVLRREQEWSDDLVHRLEFIAAILSSALVRQRDEVEVERLRRDLTHVGRVTTMGELGASIAHELNQPLTAILSNAQVAERLIASGVDAKDLSEILADIVADNKRASEVIRRLRAFVKNDATSRSPLDINGVILDVIGLVRSDAIIRGVSLDLNLTPELPTMLVDRVQLQQVVLNLILNGIDAMHDALDRRLRIATEIGDDGALCVAVTDRGPGISEHDASRIFEPFYTTKPHGLGMGLSIARSLIAAHGGRLWAENNREGGATFTFTLPAMKGRDS